MNHIIHGCSHPKWRDTAYGSEQEIFQGIQEYMDRLIRTCRQGQLSVFLLYECLLRFAEFAMGADQKGCS